MSLFYHHNVAQCGDTTFFIRHLYQTGYFLLIQKKIYTLLDQTKEFISKFQNNETKKVIYSAKKETHKGILCILNQIFSVTLLDIDSECLLLKN